MTEEHKEKLKLARERAQAVKLGQPGVVISPEKPGEENAVVEADTEMMAVLKSLASAVGSINKRLTKIETGGVNEFMESAKVEDIEKASAGRAKIDGRVVDIVNRTLGEDFGIKMDTFPDRPGYLFTLIVPQRLSDTPASERPVMDEVTRSYKQRPDGQGVMTETYYPEDRRSRALSSEQSFDAIKEHCERVRSYIVAYYSKMNKPLPEFRLK